jgi:DNA-directed RNA polymerase subunit RPC12/RpoP
VEAVTDLPAQDTAYEVVCPHCKKTFTAELIAGQTERHRGFKCPHCKLFVPESRVEDATFSGKPD